MAVSLPEWLKELRNTEIVRRVHNDPRSTAGAVLGIAREAAMEAAGWGQADFDSTWGSLTAEDRVLLYAHFFQKGHLEELYEAFRQIFADTHPDNPIVVDLGCGPFTGGLALAGVGWPLPVRSMASPHLTTSAWTVLKQCAVSARG